MSFSARCIGDLHFSPCALQLCSPAQSLIRLPLKRGAHTGSQPGAVAEKLQSGQTPDSGQSSCRRSNHVFRFQLLFSFIVTLFPLSVSLRYAWVVAF